MELALLLVLLVIVELVLTVWFLARQRLYLKRVSTLEAHVSTLSEVVGSLSKNDEADVAANVELPVFDGIGSDDLSKVDAMLSALGYRRD